MGTGNEGRARLTTTIDKNTLMELSILNVDESTDDETGQDWWVEHNAIFDKTRWGILYWLVVRKGGSTDLFGFTYERPGGESNIDFWGEHGDVITLTQVFEKTVTVTEYE
jgi:hypothetical protein